MKLNFYEAFGRKLFLLIAICSFCKLATSQPAYVTWVGAANITGTTGTYPGGAAAVVIGGPGFPFNNFNSPSGTTAGLGAIGNATFSTNGPRNQTPAQSLTFTFSTPVIVTRLDVADIDLGFIWDDSFIFNGINFIPANGTNCNPTANGVTATIDLGPNFEFANWICSGNLVNNFNINYIGNNANLTTAFLAYAIQVYDPFFGINLPQTQCTSVTPFVLPNTLSGGVTGTWSPATVNTAVIGTAQYTFTPNAGQPLTCSFTIPITVQDCCPPTLTSQIPVAVQIGIQRSSWIDSRDNITFGNGAVGQGVVYVGGDFVNLLPENANGAGFNAITGSQFAAYIANCPFTYTYRNQQNETEYEKAVKSIRPSHIRNSPQPLPETPVTSNISVSTLSNPGRLRIHLGKVGIKELEILTVLGQQMLKKSVSPSNIIEVDISHLSSGIYIVKVLTNEGKIISQKFFKD